LPCERKMCLNVWSLLPFRWQVSFSS
jgi:hypothetical protein